MVIRIAFLIVALSSALRTQPVSADQTGAFVAYVSGSGSDNNNCLSTNAPCASIGGALSKIATAGTVACIDPPTTFTTLVVNTSATIACKLNFPVNISIELPSSDTKQTVHLLGLAVNVHNVAYPITIVAAGNVILQDMIIEGATGAAVRDVRTTAGRLRIQDTVIAKNTGIGVLVAGNSGNFAIFENVTLDSNTYGVAVASGNRVSITHSSISGNSVAGVEADGGSLVIVDGSTISNNNVGIQSGSAIRLSNNNIQFNTTAVSGATGTYGNNRFAGNGSDGTALTPVGASSTDLAQK